MTTHHLSPSGRPLARIIGTFAVLLTSSGCGAVVQDVFEGGFCSSKENEVRRVAVTPRSLTIAAGDSAVVKAEVTDSQGNWSLCLPLVSWASSDSTVAVVRGISLIEASRAVAIQPGTAYLKATAQGYRDSVRVTVTTR